METLDARLQKRMHVSLYALLFLTFLLGLSILLESCSDRCEVRTTYTVYEPVYTTMAFIDLNTGVTEPQPIQSVGKIYLKGDLILINNPGKGIHVVDNSNVSEPKQISFLNIPGNYSMAVNGNTLYADSYVDMVLFDISDMHKISKINRMKNVFDYFNYDVGFDADSTKGVITSWAEKEDVQVSRSDCSFVPAHGIFAMEGDMVLASEKSNFYSSLAIAPGNGSGPGVGGSMATFTISHNHLYTLGAGSLRPFNIINEASPVAESPMQIAWDSETIFPLGDNLFIGSSSGMRILDIKNPSSPTLISVYEHVRSCDPVVVDGNNAFVTLRSGTECQGFTNQLEVIDIKDLANPQLVKAYPMFNPHGLGIDSNTLFVCDGAEGLKIYDANNTLNIDAHLIAHYKNINAYDVIPYNNRLVMIGDDGLRQYDYTDVNNIKQLSYLAVNNK